MIMGSWGTGKTIKNSMIRIRILDAVLGGAGCTLKDNGILGHWEDH
jgi:hypothetical protein